MTNDNPSAEDFIEAVCHNTIEFVFISPLTDLEKFKLLSESASLDIDCAISASSLIVTFEADEVEEVTPILESLGLIGEIGLIKHVTEYSIHNAARHMRVDFD